MARRAHCPYCDGIVELPHSCPQHQEYLANLEASGEPYQGPRDDEGRPIGEAVTGGRRVPPRYRQPEPEDAAE